MLGSTKSNIYVSVSRGLSGGEHTWLISVEPHHIHVPGTKHPEPKHFYATAATPEAQAYTVHTIGASSESVALLGNILVAQKSKSTPDDIEALLKSKLAAAESSDLPSENVGENEPDHWIRKGLHILQAENVLEKFDVGEFMTFAHAYLARRKEFGAPALIAYPRLDKDHEKKAQENSLWVSYPTESKIASI